MGTPVNLLVYSQKCQGVPCPRSVKNHCFRSGPVSVDPICAQPSPPRCAACGQVLALSIHKLSNRGSRIPEPLLSFTLECLLRVQISQGLGPFFQTFTGFDSIGVSKGMSISVHPIMSINSKTDIAKNPGMGCRTYTRA